ncbi:DUF6178 family protein [Pigmentibacter sp. JX0631]|uniref:DUF6178 family protein n=1 Tax=Pigmentibacter sp. JX0631 TaxID=2976982 RepID=UPI0024686896|nr:DUF6178 family protein [Pigmentibacter sp. JX0631]WGL61464.1 DUF6178 family protein [Pigmentibacter sp. JX0631]
MFMVYTPKNLSEEMESLRLSQNSSSLQKITPQSAWKLLEPENPLAPAVLDVNWLITQPLLPFLVQVAPAHLIFRSIMVQGMEDSLEVIEWIRGEQLQKVLDFDLWQSPLEHSSGEISFARAVSWIRAWLEIGSNFAAKRFFELDEETIVLVLSKLFQIVPEGVGIISEDIRENWLKTMDNRFYLQINDEDSETYEILKPFIDDLYSYNPRIAASTFAHAAMLIRQESLADGLKWKEARLSDQGFVSKEDALEILKPKDFLELKKSLAFEIELEKKKQEVLTKYPKKTLDSANINYDSEVTDQVVHFLGTLEPEDGIRYMQLALGMDELKKISGSSNIDPSYFYEDEDFIAETAEKIVNLCNKILTKIEFHKVNTKQAYEALLIEEVFAYIVKQNMQQAMLLKERIARTSNVIVSAFMQNIDNQSISYALQVERGALNIGLQYMLQNKSEFSVLDGKILPDVELAAYFISTVGPEFVFHLGWNMIHSIPKELSKEILFLDAAHENLRNKLKTIQTIKMSDGTEFSIGLDKLVEKHRFADVKKWLSSIEGLLPIEIYLVLEGFFDRVPMLCELITTKTKFSNKLSPTTKPFETLQEINMAKEFIQNIGYNFGV